jgi:hypothetical protein
MATLTEKLAQLEPPPVIGYTLELTVPEAECLRHALCSSGIGKGCSSQSAKLLCAIFAALDNTISRESHTKYVADFKQYLDCK